jgi:nucleoside-diphosphate-sugar epimerase
MVYCPPIDRTVTALARLIRKLRFFPYWGRMNGLRQPLHAEDLAIAAAQAMVSDAAKDLAFDLPGGETLSFRDMVSRIFRALDLPPIMVPIPRFALNIAIKPYVKARPSVIGDTSLGVVDRVIALMNTNMVLDVEPARMAFGFCPRPFAPVFPASF